MAKETFAFEEVTIGCPYCRNKKINLASVRVEGGLCRVVQDGFIDINGDGVRIGEDNRAHKRIVMEFLCAGAHVFEIKFEATTDGEVRMIGEDRPIPQPIPENIAPMS